MKSVGFWPTSVEDGDVVSIDFGPNLGGASITGTPVVAGVNCTATFFAQTPQGVVAAKVTPNTGVYAGAAQITVQLSDGRPIARQVDLRFL